MNVYLSHQTALEYWRRHPASPKRRRSLRGGNIDDCIVRSLDVAEMNLERWVTPPFEVLVPKRERRRHSGLLTCRLCSKPLPSGSFSKVARNVAVSSPELCFIQMATELSLPRLVLLGYELCGAYTLRPQAQGGFVPCEPLTSVESLRSFLNRAGSLDGVVNARRALEHVANGSASPTETQLSLLLCMPLRYGGYGIELPRLNQAVELGELLACEPGRSHCRFDLFWPEAGVCVEYNGDAPRTGPERIAGDAVCANDLINEGFTVITVTREQLHDAVLFDDIAHIVAKRLETRLRVRIGDFGARRDRLRREIFA